MKLILVTGATGYVGGRLVPRLIEGGRQVRILVRDPRRVAGRKWAGVAQVARADLSTGEGLEAALRGVDTAYYLVHSMSRGRNFAASQRKM